MNSKRSTAAKWLTVDLLLLQTRRQNEADCVGERERERERGIIMNVYSVGRHPDEVEKIKDIYFRSDIILFQNIWFAYYIYTIIKSNCDFL